MKVLVVWYSRSGTTRAVANEIIRLGGWDGDEIIDRQDRSGWGGFLRSAVDARLGHDASLQPAGKDPAAYDLVVMGTPVWTGRIASPLATYLRANAARMKQVAFFVTCGGSGAPAVLAELESLAGRPPLARLAVHAWQVATGDHKVPARGFVEELRDALRQRGRSSGPELRVTP